MKVQIHENAALRRLAAATIAQAVKDLKRRSKPGRQLDALLWLTSKDFPWWAEAAEMPFADPFRMLATGGARKLRHKRSSPVDKRLEDE